jgi:hypothetical protein
MFHFSFELYLLSPLSCAYYNQNIHQKATFNNTSVSIPWRSMLLAEETGLSRSDVITRRLPHVERELLTLPENLISPLDPCYSIFS